MVIGMYRVFMAEHGIAKNGKIKAFTLAETLITLAIIGVVAILVIPSMTASIQTRVRERQVQVSKVKFNKAAQLMALNSAIGPYYSDGLDFVQNLGKHLKINLVCKVGDNPSELPSFESCLGDNYSVVRTSDGEEVEISSLANGGKSFGIKLEDDTNSWNTPSVAFYTIDGVRYVISYNTKCPEVEPKVMEGNAAAGCIAGMVDVDGDKKPNQLGKDVYLIGSAKSIGKVCIGKSLGLCLSYPISVADILTSKGFVSYSECEANKSKWGLPDDFCEYKYESRANTQGYASIIRECGGIDKMATNEEIAKIVNYIYGGSSYTVGRYGSTVSGLPYNDASAARASEFGLPDSRATATQYSGIHIATTDFYAYGNSGASKYFFTDAVLFSDGINRVSGTTQFDYIPIPESYVFCKQ